MYVCITCIYENHITCDFDHSVHNINFCYHKNTVKQPACILY